MNAFIQCKIEETKLIKVKECPVCKIHLHIADSWHFLHQEIEQEYFQSIIHKLHLPGLIFPPFSKIFAFTKYHAPNETKIVIVGQDPYHNIGQATGLAFSVNKHCKIPKSLQNIFKELKNNYPEYKIPKHGNLDSWALQGVLLLNNVLTVYKNKPDSHKSFGWQIFTSQILKYLNGNFENIVYVAWGKKASKLVDLVDITRNLVLRSPHPSPFSAHTGFFGCKHFLIANEYLTSKGKEPIKW